MIGTKLRIHNVVSSKLINLMIMRMKTGGTIHVDFLDNFVAELKKKDVVEFSVNMHTSTLSEVALETDEQLEARIQRQEHNREHRRAIQQVKEYAESLGLSRVSIGGILDDNQTK